MVYKAAECRLLEEVEVAMKALLYWIVGWITKIHNYILRLNDAFEYDFSDKELHFLVIGMLGMVLIFMVYPVFRWLADRNHILTIAFIYVFTLIIVLTFAIEIGQKVTGSGSMEFADIMTGVLGFLLMYAVFALVRRICRSAGRLRHRQTQGSRELRKTDTAVRDERADRDGAYDVYDEKEGEKSGERSI